MTRRGSAGFRLTQSLRGGSRRNAKKASEASSAVAVPRLVLFRLGARSARNAYCTSRAPAGAARYRSSSVSQAMPPRVSELAALGSRGSAMASALVWDSLSLSGGRKGVDDALSDAL